MMNTFGVDELFLPTIAIFFATLFTSQKVTKNFATSICAAFLKSGVFAIYFGYIFDGTYTFLDDWSYLEGGEQLLLKDIGITNLVESWEFVLMIGRGDHFVYYLYNTYAFRLFGEGYYSPVALNILLTIGIAYFGTRLAVEEFKMNKSASKWFYLFLLLHPDILAWSNTINGKDILVLQLHVLLLTSVSIYMHGQHIKALCLAAMVVLPLLFLRFYVPIMFGTALLGGAIFFNWRCQLKSLGISVSLIVLMFFLIGESAFQFVTSSLQENFVNPFYGFIRMLLTPIPFNAQREYAFLNFPALFHWMLMPFVVFGLIRLWRMNTRFSRFFIAYLLVFFSLYAVYWELQGPRHRVQMDYAWAILQFIGVMVALGVMKLKEAPPRAMVAP